MYKKWIVLFDIFYFGNKEFHKELIPNYDMYGTDSKRNSFVNQYKKQILGGGYWEYDAISNTIFLYGSSIDFGRVESFMRLYKVDWTLLKDRGIQTVKWYDGELSQLLRESTEDKIFYITITI